jgi:hypothetical protein
VLLVAVLRAQAVPARARCGFAAYLERGRFTDHWLCERWDARQARWILVDAQLLDEAQRAEPAIDVDPLDVPRDGGRFLFAAKAWARCRAGEADPSDFGIFAERGLWFIGGDLVRDLAALEKVEMLPWEVWDAMPNPDEPLTDDRLDLCDRLAAIARAAPDAEIDRPCALHDGGGNGRRLRVPGAVGDTLRYRAEPIRAARPQGTDAA